MLAATHSSASQGPQEGLDHLLLLPDCVLAMDSTQLKRDLAGLQFSLHLLSGGPEGSVWLSGATPVDPKQNGKPATVKQGSCSAQQPGSTSTSGGETQHHWYADDSSIEGKESHIDREERLKLLREKQNEDRQRKLDELKQQALAAQKFREQKEEERRRRLEEMRMRDTDRRHQVEERKRQIWEAERDRREAILRKNQEREARIESKRKNERSSIVFAFGSSTPRMLEPGDTGTSYWNTRRATSTTNVMTLSLSAASPGPLTRRSSERELDGSGSKKRAASAGGIDRKIHHDPLRMTSSSIYEVFQWGGDNVITPPQSMLTNRNDSLFNRNDEMDGVAAGMSTIVNRSAGRRKTDLTPTAPQSASREAMCSPTPGTRTPRSSKTHPGLRSGEMTPSRPQSSLSQHSVTSQLSTASASLRSRSATTSRKPRPVSIAVTGVTSPADKGLVKSPSVGGVATDRPPLPKVHSTKKTANANSNATTIKNEHPKKTSTEKEKSKTSKTSTVVNTPKATPLHTPLIETNESDANTVDEQKSQIETNGEATATTTAAKSAPAEEHVSKVEKPLQPHLQDPSSSQELITQELIIVYDDTPKEETLVDIAAPNKELPMQQPKEELNVIEQRQQQESSENVSTGQQQSENGQTELPDADMTSSMIAKIRITTEEEAKAALAERRRIAREQAEREAELERQRLEAERLAEEERLRKEEEDQRRMEEEQLRLLEEARVAEELRLKQAIEEAQRREEEERKRKEEELKLKIEKEEAEKKAKEEAEKMRIEMEQRLKKEEEDRQARRKRVEAIMLRTRGKGSMTSNTTPTKDGEESEEISPADEARKLTESVTSITSEHEQFLHSERSHTDANGMSSNKNTTTSSPQQQQQQQQQQQPPQSLEQHEEESTTTTTTLEQLNNKHNGHHNGSYHSVAQNNVTNSLLVNLGTDSVGQILDVPGGKIPQDQPQFIPQFQEKKEPHTVNDLLS